MYGRAAATEEGRETAPDNFGYLLCCYVAETEEKANEEAKHFVWRMGATTRAPREYMNPVGYRSQASAVGGGAPHGEAPGEPDL